MMTSCADQELKPRTMALAAAPGKTPDRSAVHQPNPSKTPNRARDLFPAGPPGHAPPTRPVTIQVQARPARLNQLRHEEFLPAAPVRPQTAPQTPKRPAPAPEHAPMVIIKASNSPARRPLR